MLYSVRFVHVVKWDMRIVNHKPLVKEKGYFTTIKCINVLCIVQSIVSTDAENIQHGPDVTCAAGDGHRGGRAFLDD